MTYLQFHLIFMLPALLAAAWLARGSVSVLGTRARWSIPALMAIAFAYTTPWDNYLVAREVWGYGQDRVIGTIGYVPVEEYMFFLLQPLLTGLVLYALLARLHATNREPHPAAQHLRGRAHGATKVRIAGAFAWGIVASSGVILLRTEAGTYMGLILAWAAPVLALQWACAGHLIVRRTPAVTAAVAVPTLYLWVADAIAIRLGIWHIAERFTLGPRPFGLPIEEATFFLVTNILIVQGLMLFLYWTPFARRAQKTLHGLESAA
jgi:lycopene beta-cyclase